MSKKNKKQLIIIAGPNGSGKTTLANEILKDQALKLLNADAIAQDLNPNDLNSVRLQAGKIFLKTLHDNIQKNKSFAVESTLAGSYLIKIIKELKKKKYLVSIIYIFLDSPETSIKRIKIRVEKGGHFVPDEDVIRRFHRSKVNFWQKYRNLVDHWQLLYNGEEGLIHVAGGGKSKFEISDEIKFKIFKKDKS